MIDRSETEGIVTLRLAHGKASAFDVELMVTLREELRRVRESDARAVILTGTGNIFSAGVDLFRLTNEGRPYVMKFVPALNELLTDLFLLPLPVVAAVNGHAIAGGCIITAASDYRLMAAGNGRIGAPEMLVGVPFPAIALEILRFATAPSHIQELVYTGKTVLADEAMAKGLVDEVVPADVLLDRAMTHARQFAAIPRDAFRIVKNQLRAHVAERVRTFADADTRALDIWADPATHEHIRAYLAKTVGKKS